MPPKKSTTVQALLLTQKAELKEISIATQANGTTTLAAIQSALKKKSEPELIGSYKGKQTTLFLFGYTKGKAGMENKHEMPPPHDTVTLFGDALLLASKDASTWSTPVPFKAEEYEAFYTKAFGGGFEESDSEAEEEQLDIADIAQEAEEEAEVEEEAEEAEEAEEEVEEEADAGDGGEDGDVVAAPVVRAVAKKKVRKQTAAAAAAAAAAGAVYLHVPAAEELQREVDLRSGVQTDAQEAVAARVKMLTSIRTLFKADLSADQQVDFERCIYNATLRAAEQRHVGKAWSYPPFQDLYRMMARHLCANFLPSSYVKNNELLDRYKHGYVTLQEIAEMDPYQLFEGHWKESFVQQQIREKRQLEGNRAMATDRFTCTRCWKKECTYYELQTRSADEPMTIFITCLNCGKHWRQ